MIIKIFKKKQPLWGPVIQAALFLCVLLWFLTSAGNLYRGSGDEMQGQLETALRRASASYYAAEGVYPPTLDALTMRYGLQIADEYVVFYENFASNLMPDITVLRKGEK